MVDAILGINNTYYWQLYSLLPGSIRFMEFPIACTLNLSLNQHFQFHYTHSINLLDEIIILTKYAITICV